MSAAGPIFALRRGGCAAAVPFFAKNGSKTLSAGHIERPI